MFKLGKIKKPWMIGKNTRYLCNENRIEKSDCENSLSKLNLGKDEFDNLYLKTNPWNFDGSFDDEVRQKILDIIFRTELFEHGVDIACGEGYLTAQLGFVKNKVGIDISEIAIERAKENYPDIKFLCGNAFQDKLLENKFDFVSCFEALYYPPTPKERMEALECIKKYGSRGTIYAFSVVTIGENEHRKYFTKKEFLGLLSEAGYELCIHYGFVANSHSAFVRIIRKFIRTLLPNRISVWLWAKIVMLLSNKVIYQHIFVCQSK